MTISALTVQQLSTLIISYSDISSEKEKYEKIISNFFLHCLEISFIKIAPYRILWLHVGNKETTNVVNNFKKVTGNIHVFEIFSLYELRNFTEKIKSHKFKCIVTEMGFWADKNRELFDKIAGLTAMKLLNKWAPGLKDKFVISMRVGRNEESLKDRSKMLGFMHTEIFTPVQRSIPLLSSKEMELHQCVAQLRKNLFSKPLSSPNQQQSYPIKHFNIEFVLDIENSFNKYHFLKKQGEFLKEGKSTQWDWQFHGSNSKDATYNIAVTNFSLNRLSEYSGNRGCYGEGLYFSPHGYMPMRIAIVQGHLMVLACKVMKGITQVVKCFSQEDYTKGVPIAQAFDSNISDSSTEVVVRNPEQILPSFVIKFSLTGLKKLGDIMWETPKGCKKRPRIHCNEESLDLFN